MDLFYRLNAFPILLPPLRQRAEDIPLLANHYGNLFAKKLGYQYHGIVSSSLKKLQAYHWPGNIRELQNLVEQGLLIHGNRKLVLSPQTDNSAYGSANTATSLENLEINEEELDDITLKDIDAKKNQLEKAYLEAILQKTKWRISGRHGAAALLDAKAPTLESRLKKLGITRK
ncbi:MAG: sigma-54-dependent Fis family transcriptional regulator, partial [Cytophagales bacterium]|nr:sigma-54-dependent Fis family transcriptional regulator [Cytophagales bacterium]